MTPQTLPAHVRFGPPAADVFSYGYAVLAAWWVLDSGIYLQLPAGIAVMVIFVLLRGVARELRKEQRRAVRRQPALQQLARVRV